MIKREAVFHSDHRSLHRKNGLQLRFCRPQWFSTFTPNKNDSKVKHRFLQLNGYRLHTFFSLLCFVSILKFALDLFFRFLFFLRIIGWGGQVGGLMGELVRGVLWGPQLLFYLVLGIWGDKKMTFQNQPFNFMLFHF